MRIVSELRGKYATHIFTDRAIDIIKRHNKSQPLFLYVSSSAVHSANRYALFQAPFNEVLKFPHIRHPERRIFAAMVSELDTSIGKIFRTLDKMKMLDNTIFIISTDNGGEVAGLRGGVGSNWPLRGNKQTLWEGGVKGVGVVWSELLKYQSRIENNLIHISDWLPTLYHAAGGNVTTLGSIYGIDQWDTLSTGVRSPREEILHNIDPIDGASALRFRNYKLINGSNLKGNYNGWYGPNGRESNFLSFYYENLLRSSYSWETLNRKGYFENAEHNILRKVELNCFRNSKKNVSNCDPNVSPCLFDVKTDPCELENIAMLHPEVVIAMQKRLEEFKSSAIPPVDSTFNPLADPALHQFAWTNWADSLNDHLS
ncbi:arylsulfatase I-like isoform X2 [Centruroides vittatus]